MVKIIKRILLISFILILAIGGGIYYLLDKKPLMLSPFTYKVHETIGNNTKNIENADILIVGDRMGLYLNQFMTPLKTELAQDLHKNFIVSNWSRENEGIHRTINKLKQLKRLPPLIIYAGASSEWYEKKFNPLDRDKILFNFNQYHDEKISSLMITFPVLSKAFYKKVDLFDLTKLPSNPPAKRTSNFVSKEIEYLYYQEEVRELIDYVKRNRSNLILITTPINALIRPKEACQMATNQTIIDTQQEIEVLLKNGSTKDAFIKANMLAKEGINNSISYYLLGMAAKSNNDTKLAREAFINASVYDCYNWRGNGVYNSIMLNQARHYQVEAIDFSTPLLNSQIQGEEVFFDDIYPQNIYYNNLINELIISAKKYFNIK